MQPVGAPVRSWLRLEAATVAVAALAVWAGMGGGWGRLSLLILVPDLALLGYLWGPRAGAALYNAAHSYAAPLLIGVVGSALDHRGMVLTSAVWVMHIGLDRALGYGLKYATAFQDTHLGRVGREPVHSAVMRTGEHMVHFLHPKDRPQTLAR